ncbi:MAG: transposase [Oscillospiraceae bacterium]|nr:transposase [Oscillospiraceae bacterium]
MNFQFRDINEICFPNVMIVIDRFYVTRQTLYALKAEKEALTAA